MASSDRSLSLILIIIWSVLDFGICLSDLESGSFFGDGYIHLPLDDASSETDIKLQFRTSRSNGLLFIAVGSPDYCVLELKEGRVLVHLDLGSGDMTLTSPPNVILNDLQWHSISLQRTQDVVHLTLDGIFRTNTTTPGAFVELNIDKGVFLGGIGSYFKDYFFGNIDKFRGCLKDVTFNSVDVLHRARQTHDFMNIYGVEWGCSPEFSATSDQAITFSHNTSFIIFPSLKTRRYGQITFNIKTRQDRALVVYNSGRLEASDLIAVELAHGRIKLTVNKGSGRVELFSDQLVNDGNWHQIEIGIIGLVARLTVDGLKKEGKTTFGDTIFLDLHGELYVGGVDAEARSFAVQNDLYSLQGGYGAGGSLIGCIQNFKVEGKLMGFRQVLVSRGLKPGCAFHYPCVSNPCIEGARCEEDGINYDCICPVANCFKPGATGTGEASTPLNHVLHIQDIHVIEDSNRTITTKNIGLLLDNKKHNIRDAAVRFRVVNPPVHGHVMVNADGHTRKDTVFTLQDLQENQVHFKHDGSELGSDSVGLELDFMNVPQGAPDSFTKKYGFTVMIQIAPMNDLPTLVLPPDDTLILVENTELIITPKILRAEDSDNYPRHLEFNVRYSGNNIGYFELNDVLGVRARIRTFTQEDIEEGKIKFVHRGVLLQEFLIHVFDGRDVSESKILRIQAVPLILQEVHNTGLITTSGTPMLILRDNLTFVTNAPNQDFEVRYEIVLPPQYGEIQKQQYSDNTWHVARMFTQRHIDKSRIRYMPDSFPVQDEFRFQVYTIQTKDPEEYTFALDVVAPHVSVQKSVLFLVGVREEFLSRKELKAVSAVPYHSPDDIVYHIIATPTEGHLMRVNRFSRVITKRRLKLYSNFTQSDIDNKRILFRLQKALHEPISDNFQVRVFVPGYASDVEIFAINYMPSTADVRSINNGLEGVFEGGNKWLTPEDLFMSKSGVRDFSFIIIEGPFHGVIKLINTMTGQVENNNATSFSTTDIKQGRVAYQHDNSENEDDRFSYIAVPVLENSDEATIEISEFSGNFDIHIILQNDNAPTRAVENAFHVVANHGRVITLNDLQYVDPDINFDNSQLQYIVKNFSNGKIVDAFNHTKIIRDFKQEDIADGKVYFQHHGEKEGLMMFWVSDGVHTITDGLMIIASEPYITIANNSGLTVHKGGSVALGPSNLSAQYNVDVDAKQVKVIITEPPMHGFIKKSGFEKLKFNLEDMKQGLVIYEHDDTLNFTDSFSFTFKINDLEANGEVTVKVTPNNPLLLKIDSNRDAAVDQGGVLVLTSEYLNYSRPNTSRSEIRYTVNIEPKYGSLTMEENPGKLTTFTQDDIDNKRVQYINLEPDHDSDIFLFDVTSGMAHLREQDLLINIVPNIIPLHVSDFDIKEGDSHLIGIDVIKVTNQHFTDKDIEFVITHPPAHGIIAKVQNEHVSINQFSHTDLKAYRIMYIHDGSNSLEDRFAVQARLTTDHEEKQSNPHSIDINIISVNDDPPFIINNKKLKMWMGSIAKITPEYLLVGDNDTQPQDLMFIVTNPSQSGWVALYSDTGNSILNFTQGHINRGEVVFVHTGALIATFDFEVTDGMNRIQPQTFQIHASSLELVLEINKPLQVYPGITQPITSRHLRAVTNDQSQTRPIEFTLQSKPAMGMLVRNLTGIYEEVMSFTQKEVNDGLIAYQPSLERKGWMEHDGFRFDVSTDDATPIPFQQFNITISFQNINAENRDKLIDIKKAVVTEGDSVVLTLHHLDNSKMRRTFANSSNMWSPEITYVLTTLPVNGTLIINGENATEDKKFTQSDIKKGLVKYVHDHSDSLWDSFEFLVEIDISGQTLAETEYKRTNYVNVFNITILPVNDQDFKMITTYPGIQLVQGFTATITNKELLTVDPDTGPEHIVYEVRNPPNNGFLMNKRTMDHNIRNFTQADINNNHIVFVHDGGMQKASAFYFCVSDGHHKPFYSTFLIKIDPLTLELTKVNPITISQGRVSALLTKDNFVIDTNGNREKIHYNITTAPQFGNLYMRDEMAMGFSQKNVDEGWVTYIQTDLTGMEDSFTFTVYDTQNSIKGNTIEMHVISQVKQRETALVAKPKETVTLTLKDLNASALAQATNSDPVYWVIKAPEYGTLKFKDENRRRHKRQSNKRRHKGKGKQKQKNPHSIDSLQSNAIFKFTHQNVTDETVQYEANPINNSQPLRDSFRYVVTARNSQPSEAVFSLLVSSEDIIHIFTTEEPKKIEKAKKEENPDEIVEESKTHPPPGSQGEGRDPSQQINKDHLVIVCLVSGITVVVIVVLITVKCIKRKKKKELLRYNTNPIIKEDSKTPLSPPHYDTRSPQPAGLSYEQLGVKARTIPVISVTSDSDAGSVGSGGSRSTGSRSTPNKMPQQQVYNRDMQSPPKSPDVTKTEFSRTVPTCKVTPLLDEESDGSKSPPGGGKHEQVTFDWENIDPELLQHCRTTNPVLHKNKYWV